ncbi:MAG: insulinase family protein [Ignavibacteria bacterium]|nr:insulinase family protein [Ignavibacteria bacterium]
MTDRIRFLASFPVRALTVLFLLLSVSGMIAQSQTADRSAPPPLGPPPVLKVPPIQTAKLSNGLSVVLMEKHGVPLLDMRLLINAGTVDEPTALPGLASMTAAMMTEGAGDRNSLQLADAMDFLGARIGVSSGFHSTTVSLFTPLSKFEDALALFRDIATKPTFPAEELDRLRKDRLTAMKQWHDQPRSIASIALPKLLYGERSPYGRPTTGNEKSLLAMKVADIASFYRARFHAANATLLVAGDVTLAEILPKLESALGSWKAGTSAKTPFQTAAQVGKRTIILVDKPGAPQSEIRIGRIGVERTTKDYEALVVMNTILGGSFSSRLNQNLREKHGYTYGATSSFAFRVHPGPFTAASAVQTGVTDKALAEFMNEMKAIITPVSDEELARAKNYVAYGYPQNFQTVSDIAGELEELVQYNLPETHFNSFISRILSVTKEDVHRVAKKYIDPENIVIVVVGDRKVIEDGIRGLNLGDMKIMSITDILGDPPK